MAKAGPSSTRTPTRRATSYSEIYDNLCASKALEKKIVNCARREGKNRAVIEDRLNLGDVQKKNALIDQACVDFSETSQIQALLEQDIVGQASAFFLNSDEARVIIRTGNAEDSISDALEVITNAKIARDQIITFCLRSQIHFISVTINLRDPNPSIIRTDSRDKNYFTEHERDDQEAKIIQLREALSAKFNIPEKDINLYETDSKETVRQRDILCNFHVVLNNSIDALRCKYNEQLGDEVFLDELREKISDIFGETITGNTFAEIIANAQDNYVNLPKVIQNLQPDFQEVNFRGNIDEVRIQALTELLTSYEITKSKNNLSLQSFLKSLEKYYSPRKLDNITSIEIVDYLGVLERKETIQIKPERILILDRQKNSLCDYADGDNARKLILQKRIVMAAKMHYAVASELIPASNLARHIRDNEHANQAIKNRLSVFLRIITETVITLPQNIQQTYFNNDFLRDLESLSLMVENSSETIWAAQTANSPDIEFDGDDAERELSFTFSTAVLKQKTEPEKNRLMEFANKLKHFYASINEKGFAITQRSALSALYSLNPDTTKLNQDFFKAVNEGNEGQLRRIIATNIGCIVAVNNEQKLARELPNISPRIKNILLNEELWLTAKDGIKDEIRLLIDQEANYKAINSNGENALKIAARFNKNSTALEYLTSLDYPYAEKLEALEIAINNQNCGAINGIAICIKDEDIKIQLERAIELKKDNERNKNPNITNFVNAAKILNSEFLLRAVKAQNIADVREAIRKLPEFSFNTALHFAIISKNKDLINIITDSLNNNNDSERRKVLNFCSPEFDNKSPLILALENFGPQDRVTLNIFEHSSEIEKAKYQAKRLADEAALRRVDAPSARTSNPFSSREDKSSAVISSIGWNPFDDILASEIVRSPAESSGRTKQPVETAKQPPISYNPTRTESTASSRKSFAIQPQSFSSRKDFPATSTSATFAVEVPKNKTIAQPPYQASAARPEKSALTTVVDQSKLSQPVAYQGPKLGTSTRALQLYDLPSSSQPSTSLSSKASKSSHLRASSCSAAIIINTAKLNELLPYNDFALRNFPAEYQQFLQDFSSLDDEGLQNHKFLKNLAINLGKNESRSASESSARQYSRLFEAVKNAFGNAQRLTKDILQNQRDGYEVKFEFDDRNAARLLNFINIEQGHCDVQEARVGARGAKR